MADLFPARSTGSTPDLPPSTCRFGCLSPWPALRRSAAAAELGTVTDHNVCEN